MTATLYVTPNPAKPSSVVNVTGAGFLNRKTRLLLDGAGATTNIFRPSNTGTFNVGITVSSIERTQTLVAQQNTTGKTWIEVARLPIVVKNIVVIPPVDPPPPTSNIPTTDPTGWRRILAEDFNTALPIGSWPGVYSPNFGSYANDGDTARRNLPSLEGGYWDSSKTVSVHDGMLDIWVHTENGEHYAAVPTLQPGGVSNYTALRVQFRFRADPAHGYKTAWLLWPQSGIWPRDGEIDFPEGDLDTVIQGYMHRQGATTGGDQASTSTAAKYTDWHTGILEWRAGVSCKFILDGVTILNETNRVPATPMHYVFQTETSLSTNAPDTSEGHVQLDYVVAWVPA